MTTVLTLNRASPAVQAKVRGSVPTAYKIDKQTMNALRLRMYEWNVAALADEMGVSTACVYAIRAGRTAWPRGRTFFALCDALGIEVRLYDTEARVYL